jgi:ubiquinone biosynthesis protein UbiJ
VSLSERNPYEVNAELLQRIEGLEQEVARLLVDNAELSDECDQWGEKVADCWREIDQLRAQVARLEAAE